MIQLMPLQTNLGDATKTTTTTTIKGSTDIVLYIDLWRNIVPYVNVESLLALACASKTTRDAAVVSDVANGRFSLFPTTERLLVEFAKKDGYNAFFHNLFGGNKITHKRWETLHGQVRRCLYGISTRYTLRRHC